MVKLQHDSNGNYRARKRLPDNVREEYGRLYGARHEAKFFAPKSIKSHEAKRLFPALQGPGLKTATLKQYGLDQH